MAHRIDLDFVSNTSCDITSIVSGIIRVINQGKFGDLILVVCVINRNSKAHIRG